MKLPLYRLIARAGVAANNCAKHGNTEWKQVWEDLLEQCEELFHKEAVLTQEPRSNTLAPARSSCRLASIIWTNTDTTTAGQNTLSL